MTVIIQQGKRKIIAMPGACVGISDEENERIEKLQKEYFKDRPDIIKLINSDDDLVEALAEYFKAVEEEKNE